MKFTIIEKLVVCWIVFWVLVSVTLTGLFIWLAVLGIQWLIAQ